MGFLGVHPPSTRPQGGFARQFPFLRHDVFVTMLLGMAALAAAIAIFGHSPWPHHWDATGYAIRSLELVRALDHGFRDYFQRFPGSHGPILPLLNTGALWVWPGENPFWAMAWVQILAFTLTVTIGYLAMRREAPAATAALATLIYLLHPQQLAWATELMHEGPALALVALWLLATAIDATRQQALTFAAAAFVTGVLGISRLNFAVPSLAGFGVYALWRLARAAPAERWWLLAYAAAPIACTTVVWHTVTNFYQLRYYLSFTAMDPSLQLYWQGASGSWLGLQIEFLRHVVQYWGTVPVLLIGAAAAAAVVQVIGRRPGPYTAASVFLAVVIGLLIVSQGRQERYLVPALLPALLTVAWAAHDHFWSRGVRRAALVLLLLTLGCQVLMWGERMGLVMPPMVRLALRADTAPPHPLKGATDHASRLTARVRQVVPPHSRILFVGNGYQVNNGYLMYWNLSARSTLVWDYPWDPLDPKGFPRRFAARLPNASHLLFAPAAPDDGRLYREGSHVVEQTVADWVARGWMRPVFEEPAYGVTLYAVTPGGAAP